MLQYTGESDDGQEYLLTIFEDGTHELATRRYPWETWSPPIPTRLVTPIAAAAQETRAAKA